MLVNAGEASYNRRFILAIAHRSGEAIALQAARTAGNEI